MSHSTGSRWVTLWNNGGLGLLTPSFGGGRSPKLNEKQRERLLDSLAEGEPWKKQEIQHLINQEFDVEFHPSHLPRLLDDLGLSYAIPRTERPDRPENADEILNERVADAFAEDDGDEPHNKRDEDDNDNEWTLDDDVRTDGGATVAFFDVSHPQPWDNSQRLYTVTEPTITRSLVKIDTPAVGFSAFTGESVLQFPPNQDTEEICACFEEIRSSWTASLHTSVRTRASEPMNSGLTSPRLSPGVGSPHLNTIEPVWKSLKWESSHLPLIVEGAAEYRALLDEISTKLTDQLSFASSWIENHLDEFIQKLR